MAFTALAFFGGSAPVDAFSSPERVSIVVNDSNGGGGDINFNALGIMDPTIGGAVDLKTFFGTHFRSYTLLTAFKALALPDVNQAEAQFVPQLLVTAMGINGPQTRTPSVGYLAMAVAGVNVPFLKITSPAVVGTWRIDIQLRHSIIA